jgi:hypothetical protein
MESLEQPVGACARAAWYQGIRKSPAPLWNGRGTGGGGFYAQASAPDITFFCYERPAGVKVKAQRARKKRRPGWVWMGRGPRATATGHGRRPGDTRGSWLPAAREVQSGTWLLVGIPELGAGRLELGQVRWR